VNTLELGEDRMSAKDVWTYALLVVMAVALLLHAFVPRYDWRTIDETGSISIVVYDKWTGRFQRGVYDADGNLSVMTVFTPF
jgi:hypothetical protein